MNIGFIGCGNMGAALAIAAEKAKLGSLYLSNRTVAKAEALAKTLGATVSTNEAIAKHCKYIFLGVKPYQIKELLQQLSPILSIRTDPFVLISMAAGVTVATMEEAVGEGCPIIRIMPNTPVAVGQGMIQYCTNSLVDPSREDEFCRLLSPAGRLDRLGESLMDAATALSGCGPAFVCLFAEALADGAVRCGLPREKALCYAAQTLLGTGALLLESKQHPAALKDAVCSPGGSTIEGVTTLEANAFRGAVIAAVEASYLRNKELGKEN